MTTYPVTDPRVLSGMKAQLAERRRRLGAGSSHLGWKSGFGAPAAISKFNLPGPLMGYLLQEGRLGSGTTVSLAGWTRPVAEPEIAVYIGADLPAGDDKTSVRQAISALGPAIELADLDPPPEDVEKILAGNIFHRHVILGRRDPARAGADLDGLAAHISRAGKQGSPVTELESNTGRVVDVGSHIANTLASCGERLKAGDVIIAGSVVPPLLLTPEDNSVKYRLGEIDEITVDFVWS